MTSIQTSPSLSKVLEGIHGRQHEAVTQVAGPLLVIAGPGSGKTHTLVRRAPFLIEQCLAKQTI